MRRLPALLLLVAAIFVGARAVALCSRAFRTWQLASEVSQDPRLYATQSKPGFLAIDGMQQVAGCLSTTVTPEVFLLSASDCRVCESLLKLLKGEALARRATSVVIAVADSIHERLIAAVQDECAVGRTWALYRIHDPRQFSMHTGLSVVPAVVVSDRRGQLRCVIRGIVKPDVLSRCFTQAPDAFGGVRFFRGDGVRPLTLDVREQLR